MPRDERDDFRTLRGGRVEFGESAVAVLAPIRGGDDEVPLTFEWHAVESLRDGALYPTFLREALADITRETRHVVRADGGEQGGVPALETCR